MLVVVTRVVRVASEKAKFSQLLLSLNLTSIFTVASCVMDLVPSDKRKATAALAGDGTLVKKMRADEGGALMHVDRSSGLAAPLMALTEAHMVRDVAHALTAGGDFRCAFLARRRADCGRISRPYNFDMGNVRRAPEYRAAAWAQERSDMPCLAVPRDARPYNRLG